MPHDPPPPHPPLPASTGHRSAHRHPASAAILPTAAPQGCSALSPPRRPVTPADIHGAFGGQHRRRDPSAEPEVELCAAALPWQPCVIRCRLVVGEERRPPDAMWASRGRGGGGERHVAGISNSGRPFSRSGEDCETQSGSYRRKAPH